MTLFFNNIEGKNEMFYEMKLFFWMGPSISVYIQMAELIFWLL